MVKQTQRVVGEREPVIDPDIDEQLATKYRPKQFKDVLGNKEIIKSIRTGLKSQTPPRAYLFVGPSGCGKTTLARIIAKALDIPPMNRVEIDAASYSKVEDIRQVVETVHLSGVTVNRRMYIVDECHALSRQAWQVLLKPIEEGHRGVYWALCTTEVGKVPQTIVTRCQSYTVRALPPDEILDFVSNINNDETLECSDDVLEVIATNCNGSPRVALQYLSMCRGLENPDEAYTTISKVGTDAQVIDLIRMIVTRNGFTWRAALKLIQRLEDQDPEATRLQCLNYAAKVMLGTNDEKKALWLLHVLDAFGKPFFASEKLAPLLRAVGELCFAESE